MSITLNIFLMNGSVHNTFEIEIEEFDWNLFILFKHFEKELPTTLSIEPPFKMYYLM